MVNRRQRWGFSVGGKWVITGACERVQVWVGRGRSKKERQVLLTWCICHLCQSDV